MTSFRIAYIAMVGVACLVAASTLASQSANAQCFPAQIPIFAGEGGPTGFRPNPACATQYGSGPEIAREVVNSTIQSIVQSVRDGIRTTTGAAAVPGTAGLMRFTSEQNGNPVYQEAFGALAYAKEPVLLKAAPAPAAPSVIWGATAVGAGDSQRTSIFGGPDSDANGRIGDGI